MQPGLGVGPLSALDLLKRALEVGVRVEPPIARLTVAVVNTATELLGLSLDVLVGNEAIIHALRHRATVLGCDRAYEGRRRVALLWCEVDVNSDLVALCAGPSCRKYGKLKVMRVRRLGGSESVYVVLCCGRRALVEIAADGLVRDAQPEGLAEALRVIEELVGEYGQVRVADAITALHTSLGIPRHRARQLLAELVEAGAIRIVSGYVIVADA